MTVPVENKKIFIQENCCPLCRQPVTALAKIAVINNRGMIAINGRTMRAPGSQRAILERLVKSMPNTVSRELLAVAVYGASAYDKEWKAVDVWICYLRKALAGTGFSIRGEFGIGWRLVEDSE